MVYLDISARFPAAHADSAVMQQSFVAKDVPSSRGIESFGVARRFLRVKGESFIDELFCVATELLFSWAEVRDFSFCHSGF